MDYEYDDFIISLINVEKILEACLFNYSIVYILFICIYYKYLYVKINEFYLILEFNEKYSKYSDKNDYIIHLYISIS